MLIFKQPHSLQKTIFYLRMFIVGNCVKKIKLWWYIINDHELFYSYVNMNDDKCRGIKTAILAGT